MNMRVLVLGLLMAASLISAPMSASAIPCTSIAPCNLAELIVPGTTVEVGDKVFSGFSAPPAAAENLSVIGVTIGGNVGLEFDGGFFAGPNQIGEVVVTYTVTAPPGSLIHDIELSGNPSFTGTGNSTVNETVVEVGNPANNAAADIFSGPGGTQLFDSAILPTPAQSVLVGKEILLTGGTDGTARVSTIDQIVTQQGQVPAPSALLLLGAGLLGFIWLGGKKA